MTIIATVFYFWHKLAKMLFNNYNLYVLGDKKTSSAKFCLK